jgi:hypothetical protein
VETKNLSIGVKELGVRRKERLARAREGKFRRVVEKRLQVQWRRIIDISAIDHRQLFSDQ